VLSSLSFALLPDYWFYSFLVPCNLHFFVVFCASDTEAERSSADDRDRIGRRTIDADTTEKYNNDETTRRIDREE